MGQAVAHGELPAICNRRALRRSSPPPALRTADQSATVVTAIARSSHFQRPKWAAAEIDFHLPMSWGIGGITAGQFLVCRVLEKVGPRTKISPQRVADAYASDPLLPHYLFARLYGSTRNSRGRYPCRCRRGFLEQAFRRSSDTVCRSGPCPRSSRLSHFTRPETVHTRAPAVPPRISARYPCRQGDVPHN